MRIEGRTKSYADLKRCAGCMMDDPSDGGGLLRSIASLPSSPQIVVNVCVVRKCLGIVAWAAAHLPPQTGGGALIRST